MLTEFDAPPCPSCPTNGGPLGITVGSDGALWYTRPAKDTIGRVTMDGHITERKVLAPVVEATWITTGPDGALWLTDESGVGRMGLDGSFSQVWSGLSYPSAIASGPDGRLWVTGAGLPRDRLRRDGAEAEPHRAPEDARVVVHRRQDERVRQAHAAERHREPRILEAERTEAVERNQPERRLAERDRRRLRETAEDAVVEEPVEGREGSRHAETARE